MTKIVKIGFTGTREDITEYQKESIVEIIMSMFEVAQKNGDKIRFHHGDCKGADLIFHHAITKFLTLNPDYLNVIDKIVIHPPDFDRWRAFAANTVSADCVVEVRPPFPYLIRNRHISEECSYLIACPKSKVEEQRSGTWSTIRMFRKLEKSILIVYPFDMEEQGPS